MLTFHSIVRGCAIGDRGAWRSFVAEYTPLFAGLVGVYVGKDGGDAAEAAWRDTLAGLADDGAARLRSLSHHSEREFLVDVRRLALERASLTVPGEFEERPAGLPRDRAHAVLEGLPLVHQQVVFLKLSGYSEEAIEKLLRITPGVAKQGFERLRSSDRFSRAGWLREVRRAWPEHTESCPGPRKLIRIQDGQVSWYDRDPIERHMATCWHCLELFTSLGELRYWRREVRPLTGAEAERLVPSKLPASPPAKGGFALTRILRPRRS